MAKTYISTLFFCCFFLLRLSVGASNPAFSTKDARPDTNTCNAPAPTNFRITAASSHFIALAWTPAWLGATQTLAVLESDGQGGWIGVDTLHNVPDSAYTVDNLTAGQTYRFFLATNCSSGEQSQFKATADGITLIVDLVVNGRIPMLPQHQVQCHSIPVNVHWMGFRVSYTEENVSYENQFEFDLGGVNPANNGEWPTKIFVKRVGLYNPIVAAEDENGVWPNCIEPIIGAGSRFRIVRLINGGPAQDLAGFVDLTFQDNPPRIKLCPDFNHPQFPWKGNNYELTGLFSERSGRPAECGDRSADNIEWQSSLRVLNPFQHQLHVYFDPFWGQNEVFRTRLFDIGGRMVFDRLYSTNGEELILPTSHLPAGFYFLQVESGTQRSTFRVVKSE